ncbi:MAG TPA: DUF2891 family protein [Burkholderiales bacterium]|nr:DUF2891 family protein [Burkholderiales bacterium]
MIERPLAARFLQVALANVTREYPRKLDHLLGAPPGDLRPRAQHPAFYGSYDWHSAVHMHWLIVRLLRLHPDLPQAGQAAAVLDAHLAPAPLAAERAYFDAPGARTFERPYGWAWLLELRAETLRLAGERAGARGWAQSLASLAAELAARMRDFISLAALPVRAGTHANSAFACVLALDYARTAGDAALGAAVGAAARRWFLADRAAPLAYEPSQADFLSPTLTEALLMRKVLPPEEFGAWRAAFLPAGLGALSEPAVPPDRSDPQFCHLDGLSLSRAWALRRLAAAPPARVPDDFARDCAAAAERHLGAGLPHAAGGDYVAEHWLASFAALALGEAP